MSVAYASPAAWAQALEDPVTEEIVVVGVVHINGEPGWANIAIVVENMTAAESCGSGTSTDGGNYIVTLDESICAPGDKAVLVLQQVQNRKASDPFIVGEASAPVTFNAFFAMAPAELEDLPSSPTSESEDSAGVALVQKTTSVFEEVELLLIFLLVAGAVLLAVMAAALIRIANRRYKFLTDTFEKIDHQSEEQMKSWTAAIEAEGNFQEGRLKVFRWMVEGLVMSFVVIALIALGAAGKIEAQGIVSVLAAMVGYAAGRATS